MCIEARPKGRPNSLGTGFTRNGNHFEFDNFNLKGGSNGLTNDKLKYSVEVKDNVHSFDYEMSVESVQCFDDCFIVSTNDKSIESWNEDSLITGSSIMWNCKSSMNRKISKVIFLYEEDGIYYYKIETKKAYIDEYFKSAKVLYYPKLSSQRTDISNKQHQSSEFSNHTQSNSNSHFSNVIYKRVYVDNETGSNVAPMTQMAIPIDSKSIVKRIKGAKTNPFTILSPSKLSSVSANENLCVQYSLKNQNSLSASINLIVKQPGTLHDSTIKSYTCGEKTFKKGVIESCCFNIDPEYYKGNTQYRIHFSLGSDYEEIKDKNFGFVVEQFQPLTITSPVRGYVYDMNNLKQINVEWDYTQFKYKDVGMYLMMGRVGIDQSVYYKEIQDISAKKDVIKISSSKLSPSTKYYIRFDFNCWYIPFYGNWCSHVESDMFSIIDSTQSGGIVILSPTLGESYKTGENIIITWENGATDENEDLTISLKKDSGLFRGPFSSIQVKAKDKKATLPVPNLFDETCYYIEMEYGSGIMKTYAYSDYFSINHEQLVVFNDDDIQYNENTKELKISFRTKNHKPLDDDYFISINNNLPMFLIIDPSDTEIKVSQMQKKDEGSYYKYSITVPNYDSESFLWKYVSINYNCLFLSYFCEHEYSKQFSVPYRSVSGWNYDGEKESVINETIPLYSFSCDDDCETEEEEDNKLLPNPICSICEKVDLGLNIDCENCHVRTENGFGEFEFEMGPKGIGKARFHFYGILYAYFAIVTKFTGEYKYSFEKDLFKYPIIGTPEIDLGIVNLQFGAEIFGGFKLDFELSGEVTLTAGFEKEYQYYIDVTYPPTSMKPDEIGNEYVKALVDEGETKKIFDIEAQVSAKLTITPKIGIKAGVEVIELKGCFYFPLINLLSASYPAFPAISDTSNLALYVHGVDVPHYLEYDLDFQLNFEIFYKINLVVWNTSNTVVFNLFKQKLVKVGLITVNEGEKLAQIPVKVLESVFKEEENSNSIINDIQKDIVKLVSDTTNVEIDNQNTFAGDTKQVNTDGNTNSEIVNIGFTNSQMNTEDINLICEKIKNIDSLGDEYSNLKKYQQFIDGCGNIQVENPSLNVPEEPEPDPDVLIISPTEPINVEIGNFISVKFKFGSRFSGETLTVTAKCYYIFMQNKQYITSQEKQIKVNPSIEYSFDFETSDFSENAQYVIEIISSSFETVSSPLFTIVEKTTGVYPVNIVIVNQPEEYEDIIKYKVSLKFKGEMIGKNVPIKFQFKDSVYENTIETLEALPGEVIVADKIYDFEVNLNLKLYSYNGVYFPTITAEYSSGVRGNEFEVPFDTEIDGTILSCYPGPKSPLFSIFTVGECLKGRYYYFKAVKSGSNYIVNKYSHNKCSGTPETSDYYSEHVCTTEPLDLKEIASLYFFNEVDDTHRSSHYAAINNYFNKKDPKNPKIPRYIYSFVPGDSTSYSQLYVRDYDNQNGGIAPIKIKIEDRESSYQSIPQNTLYDFEKVYVSFDEIEMTKFDNIDHGGYVGDCSEMNGCLVCSDTQCVICHETYTLGGSKCTPKVCSIAGCGNCTSTTCIRCSDGSVPEGNVCPSSNCNKFNGCSYCTGTKCLKCKEGFSLDENGNCNEVDCSYFDGCTSCSVSECLTCSNGKDPVDGLCVSTECSSFDGCVECTKNKCTVCEDGYELIVGKCQKYDCSKMPSCTKCNDVSCLECENNIKLIDGSCKQETCEVFNGCTECSYTKCVKCDKGYYLNENGNCILNDCSSLLNCKKCDNEECMESLDGLQMINGVSYPSNCYEKDNCYRCDSDQCVQCVNGEMSNQCEKVEKEVYCLRNDMFISKVKIGECHENVDGTSSMYAFDGKGYVQVQYFGSSNCGLSGNPTAVPKITDTCVEQINLDSINSRGFIYSDICNETYQNVEILTSSECISFGSLYVKTKQTSNKIYILEYETNDCSGTPLYESNYEVNSCSRTFQGVTYQITYDSSFDCEVDDCEMCEEGKSDQCKLCVDGFEKSDGGKSCTPKNPSSCSVSNCETCVEGESDKCYTCKSGYKVNSNGKCEKDSSNDNSYGDPHGCDSVINQKNEECNGNYYTIYECSTSCKAGYSKNTVKPCSNSGSYDYCEKIQCDVQNCEACSSVDYCEICYKSYYTNNGECNRCPNNCISCEDETGNCIECENGYSWSDSIHQCEKCSEHCDKCSFDENDIETCEKCEKGYSPKSNECLRCSEHCVECSFESNGKEKCSKCEEKYNVNSETGICQEIVSHSSEETTESSSAGFLMLYLVLALVLIL